MGCQNVASQLQLTGYGCAGENVSQMAYGSIQNINRANFGTMFIRVENWQAYV